MAVYVDTLVNYGHQDWRRGEWCHMIADTLEELHDMAERIGLRREWFQNKPDHPHYDLRPLSRELAVKYGAIELSSLELVGKLKEIRENGA
ncbi:MAG TPA: DUF4031 domain-containing protein [Anaerolineaceae bacterium]|nr:DUF4031 domain-containing protein [Anaerolineaceae bacterium]